MLGSPVIPSRARSAAVTPALDELPANRLFAFLPMFWRVPPDDEAAVPMAPRISSTLRPSSLPAASAAPIGPRMLT